MPDLFNQFSYYQNDPWAQTRPTPIPSSKQRQRKSMLPPSWMRPRRRSYGCTSCGCLPFWGLLLALIFLLAAYFFVPLRTNVLLLGIDYTPPENAVGRSDTIILGTIIPLKPYVGLLSIPRDLWVNVPGYGENRINTAHFFAEANQPGSGPYATMQTIHQNFGVDVGYYVRVKFEGFRDVINAMGGVDLNLPEPMAGYPAGPVHLNGNKALAFARQRIGSDDFFRMEHGQLVMKAALKEMLNPLKWVRLPAVLLAAGRVFDTNLPWWQWPRLILALLRAGPNGMDSRIINRDMVTSFTTDQGAMVLLPDWSKINPVLKDMFGQ
jgi:polyisoprenyl-teichoic acid--peptidoglycan teichoic acid transferase